MNKKQKVNNFGSKAAEDNLDKMSQRSRQSLRPNASGKRAKALLKPEQVKDTISERNDKNNVKLS